MGTAIKQPFPQSLWERYTLTNHASCIVPTDLNDQQIVLLRAAVIRARKDLDDITAEISEQVAVISTAQEKDTPAQTL